MHDWHYSCSKMAAKLLLFWKAKFLGCILFRRFCVPAWARELNLQFFTVRVKPSVIKHVTAWHAFQGIMAGFKVRCSFSRACVSAWRAFRARRCSSKWLRTSASTWDTDFPDQVRKTRAFVPFQTAPSASSGPTASRPSHCNVARIWRGMRREASKWMSSSLRFP